MTPDHEIEAILTRHGIAANDKPEFLRLINQGQITNKQFGQRLADWFSYQVACEEVMELLSRPMRHLFPPSLFESVEST